MILKKELHIGSILYPLAMLSLMALGFLLQHLGFFEYCNGALIPLVFDGIKGIWLSPFLHSGWEHLFSNAVPIAVLLFLLFQFYPEVAQKVFFGGWFLTEFLVWIMPSSLFFNDGYTCIIGASGIVYMLAFYLFFGGVFRWNMKLLTISLLVVLYYGSLIWGTLPEEWFSALQEPSRISWQSHASGAIVGTLLAFYLKNKGEKKKKFIWEFPNYYSEKDDKIWQEYKEKYPEDFMELPQKKKEDIWKHLEEMRKK